MHLNIRSAILTCTAITAIGTVTLAGPAEAQFGIPGGISIRVPHNMPRVVITPGSSGSSRQGTSSSRRGSRGSNDDDSGATQSQTPSRSERDRALASIAPPTKEQTVVLKSITASGVIGVVGTKEQNQVGQTFSNEEDRDYTAKIKTILEKFAEAQRKANDKSRGDVTAHAIEQSLEKAFKDAKLATFESFLGENWSAERLRVLILDRALTDLRRLFEGNNRGNAPMSELDQLIQRSAQAVYRRVFELSELLAANRSSALFVQRLYQTHGGLVDDQLREVADRMITKASTSSIAKFEAPMRRDENGFALRYRAQRIVLDCLSDNVDRISSSETGIATIGEIEQKIADTASKSCAQWLDTQYGADASKVGAQQPMPLRVIWSATGPKDDPSMYGRATGAL
jgi:hypothetical protein